MKIFAFNLDNLQDLYIYKKKFMQIITNERQLVNLHVGLMPHFCQYASLCSLPPRPPWKDVGTIYWQSHAYFGQCGAAVADGFVADISLLSQLRRRTCLVVISG